MIIKLNPVNDDIVTLDDVMYYRHIESTRELEVKLYSGAEVRFNKDFLICYAIIEDKNEEYPF